MRSRIMKKYIVLWSCKIDAILTKYPENYVLCEAMKYRMTSGKTFSILSLCFDVCENPPREKG